MKRIYVDNSATTKPLSEVIEVMNKYYEEDWGNPSSFHSFGRSVRSKIAEAREIVASAINAKPNEIVFTSGGTESDNMAFAGVLNARKDKNHFITSKVEHPAVLSNAKYLQKRGDIELSLVDVDGDCQVKTDQLESMITEKTALISIMSSNNETGVIQPIKKIANIAKSKGLLLHTDAVQSLLKVKVDVDDLGVDLASFSSHKVHGPKGVGALYIRGKTKIEPILRGGHHEMSKRAGTENVAGILGFAKALEIGLAEFDARVRKIRSLRDRLESRIRNEISYIRINGENAGFRLPNISNISFESIEGEALLIRIDLAGISVSTGSACSSGSLEPSHVLVAMGVPHELAHGSIRFSFSHLNSEDEVDRIVEVMKSTVGIIRDISPLWDKHKAVPISIKEAESNSCKS